MIVVFGSMNVDLLVTVDKLPRPGETVLTPDYVLVPGGKGGNQACAAARAAGNASEVHMIGRVGTDDWGAIATGMMSAADVDVSRVVQGTRPTACALIWVDRTGENAIVVASGANLEATADQVPDALLGPATTVLLQAEVPVEQNWALIDRAHAAGARVILNVAPACPVPAATLGKVNTLVVNETEAAMVADSEGLPIGGGPEVLARELSGRHGLTCVVTLGGDGAIAVAPDGAWRVGALAVTPVDTTGAGDAFTGCLAAALDRGEGMAEALRWASVGAAMACRTVGCQSAYVAGAEIEARLDELPPAAALV